MNRDYLAIRNPGEANRNIMSLIGASTSRNSGQEGVNGEFGSGLKHALAVFLRLGMRPIDCCGLSKAEYFTKPVFGDGKTFNEVYAKYSGTENKTKSLNFCVEWGEKDWKLHMAIREVIVNAIDGADKFLRSADGYKQVEVEVVKSPRAKKGYTCFYIPYTPEVEQIYRQFGEMFLHFTHQKELHHRLINKIKQEEVRFYKQGVLVANSPGKSVFDYNFDNTFELDESRNADEYKVRGAAAEIWADASPADLAKVFKEVNGNIDIWESRLSDYKLGGKYDPPNIIDVRAKNWSQAWFAAFGDKAVGVSSMLVNGQCLINKGYRPVVMPVNWLSAMEILGLPTETSVLTQDEKEGKVFVEPTQAMRDAIDWAWNVYDGLGLTNGRSKPKIKSFKKLVSGGSIQQGFWDSVTEEVHLNADLSEGDFMREVALEEVAHHVSKAEDFSRDLQCFLFKVVTMQYKQVNKQES